MFISVSRNNQPLASISLLSSNKQKTCALLASFIMQGNCTFTVKRRQEGGRCIEEQLSTDELRYQLKALYAQIHRKVYTPVHLGPNTNPLRSSFNKRIGARG